MKPGLPSLSVIGLQVALLLTLHLFRHNSPQPLSDHYVQDSQSLSVRAELDDKGGAWLSGSFESPDGKETLIPAYFPYPVWKIQLGNLRGNGRPEVCIGVFKPTKYDPIPRKRLFIYEYTSRGFKALWAGSRVVHPMLDFNLIQVRGETKVWIREKMENGLSLVSEYHYGDFGLIFDREIVQNLP